MKITREEMPPRQAVLNIEMEDDDLEVYLQRAYQRVVQRVAVPGFRKGKAPRGIVERLLGRETLLHEALEFLLPEATAKAVQEEAPEAVADPDVELLGTEPVTIKATVPLTPQVEPGDYRSIRIPQVAVDLDEAVVEASLEELRSDSAPWEPVERPIQMEDLAVLNVTGEANGDKLIDREDSQYILNDDEFPAPGFAQALVGMAPGEAREFDLPLSADFPDEALAGAVCHFVATVKEVKEKRLPDLDDEFAKGVGEGYDTLEALRDEVRHRHIADHEREAQRGHQEAVMDKVQADAVVDLPPILVEREVDHLIADLQEGVQRQIGRRLTVEEYVSALQKTEEELRDELRPQAVVRLQRSFLLDRVADDEGIHITDADVDAEVESILGDATGQAEQLREALARADTRDTLRRSLRPRRTIERLAAIARGEGPELPAATAESEAEPEPSDAPETGVTAVEATEAGEPEAAAGP